jgi:Ca2+-binding EF-hand superfamily protein
MLDHNEAAEQEQVNEQDVFFKQLFDVFDSDKLGYITVDNFVNIFKQNIANDSLNDYVSVESVLKFKLYYD